jgi:hypothetical protein
MAGVAEPKFVGAQESIPRNRFLGCKKFVNYGLGVPLAEYVWCSLRYFGCRIESKSTTTVKDCRLNK